MRIAFPRKALRMSVVTLLASSVCIAPAHAGKVSLAFSSSSCMQAYYAGAGDHVSTSVQWTGTPFEIKQTVSWGVNVNTQTKKPTRQEKSWAGYVLDPNGPGGFLVVDSRPTVKFEFLDRKGNVVGSSSDPTCTGTWGA